MVHNLLVKKTNKFSQINKTNRKHQPYQVKITNTQVISQMINLDSTRKSNSSRGRKFFKQSVSSFNKFQDFLVAKSKQKPKPAFFADRQSLTGEVKIQKLNFAQTASSNEFLPPKSIDKFYKSSTNRSGFTVPRQQVLMSQTQTPLGNTKVWSFQATNQQFILRPQQIKAKIESNAMERFQQLFKKETNLRAKRIQQEQSRRLMKLLENTSRKNYEAKSSKNIDQSQNAYLKYGNGSRKRLNQQQQNNLTESTNLQRDVEEQSTDNNNKMKLKQSIKNSKVLNPSNNKTIDRETINKPEPNKQAQTIENKRKNSFFKDKNSVDLGKELNKKTIDIDECIKNVELLKQKIEKNRNVLLKVQTQQSESSVAQQSIKQDRPKESIKVPNQREEPRKLQTKEQPKISQPKQPKTQQVKKQEQPVKTALEEKKIVEQKKVVKKQYSKQQYSKKNSFNINEKDLFDSLPSAQIIEKIPDSGKQVSKTEENKGQNSVKQAVKKQQQQKGKISLQEMIKNRQHPKQKAQQLAAQQSIPNPKPKTPITIKGAKQVKSSRNQPTAVESNRYITEDVDEIEDVAIVARGMSHRNTENVGRQVQAHSQQVNGVKNNMQANKNQGSEKKLQSTTGKVNSTNKNAHLSTTSISKDAQKINKPTISQSPLKNQPSPTKAQPTQSKPQSSSRVEFNDSQQQHSPADELGYLLDLVQTLGSYYTDSKHFYSQPDSSMVEIVMNHKIAAYFLAQQYYFYINLFKQCAEAQEKDEFYSLTKQEFEQALQDEQMAQGVEQLKRSSQLAVKLIKMTFEKCKMYLKKHQKQLTISHELNYHRQCLQYLKAQFAGLYKLYLQKATAPLGKRLCYLIETYCLVMYLNQEEVKEYEDVDDIEPQAYARHINKFKHIVGVNFV